MLVDWVVPMVVMAAYIIIQQHIELLKLVLILCLIHQFQKIVEVQVPLDLQLQDLSYMKVRVVVM